MQDRINVAGVWVNSAVQFSNDSGVMIDSATANQTGEAISDSYQLTAGAVAGGVGTIAVACSPSNTLNNGKMVAGVHFDGATEYSNIIPGVILVFQAGTATGNVSTVKVGQFAGQIDAFGVGAGTPVGATRHQAHNDDASDVTDAAATIDAEAEYVKKIGSVFFAVNPYAPGATYKPLGGGSDQVNPYRFEVTAVAGAGPTKTISFTVDGALLPADSIRRIADGSTSNSTGIKAVLGEYYEVVDGDLTGLQFVVDPACALHDTCNILVFPARYIQITADVAGAPDAAGWGTADVPLTQAGQTAGTILTGGDAYYWSRYIVPPGASSQSNPWQMLVTIRVNSSQAANWGG
jgi:hypothetical protein